MATLKNLETTVCSYLLMSTLVLGCAEATSQSGANTVHYRSTGFSLPSPVGLIAVTLTSAADPNLPEDPSKKWLGPLSLSGMGPLALVAPVWAASGLAVGGGMILTLGIIGYGIDKSEYNAVVQGVSELNFPAMLENAIRRQSSPSEAAHEPIGHALVVVGSFGLVESDNRSACFIAVVELSVERDKEQIFNEPLLLTMKNASTDAPPVQCAKLDQFAARDGRLIRETARDYAEVLAVMITDRLKKLQR